MSEPKDSKDLKIHSSLDYHLHEWTSGSRGGGFVPADFGWRSNPKQWQEENGAGSSPQPEKKSS